MSPVVDSSPIEADTIEMNIETLKSYSAVRGMNQSDIAQAAGVSRQAVSRWFSQSGEIELRASTLLRLATSLRVQTEDLCRPLPILGDPELRHRWETELLWDRLYPSLESFIAGLHRGQRAALARLVQTCGLYEAEKIAGKQVWKRFDSYKSLIHPAYRRQAEILWNTK
jgi:transcriptional regulator with XRE-family HTH domain